MNILKIQKMINSSLYSTDCKKMGKNKLQLKRRTFLKGTVGLLGSGFSLFGLNDQRNCEPTQSDMLGPYWSEHHPSRTVLANSDEPGSRIKISGIVTADDCSTPIEML